MYDSQKGILPYNIRKINHFELKRPDIIRLMKKALDKIESTQETVDRVTSIVDWFRNLIDWVKELFNK